MPGVRRSDSDNESLTTIYHPRLWVPLFRCITPRTRFVLLPWRFVEQMITGSVHSLLLTSSSTLQESGNNSPTNGRSSPEDSTTSSNNVLEENDYLDRQSIVASITHAIRELDGEVCPKLGCTTPTDATWVSFHRSTKCTSAEDVLTLLQSSEKVLSNIQCNPSVVLALRKWADLDSRMEFRCFVRSKALVGVCPRKNEAHYNYTEADMDCIVSMTNEWFREKVKTILEEIDDYVVDCYIDRHRNVWLFDIAPWNQGTDSLLFTWDELRNAPWLELLDRAQFRCTSSSSPIRPADGMYSALPIELRHADTMSSLVEAAQQLVETEQGDE